MNKLGQNPYVAIGVLIIIVLILGGYISVDTLIQKYDLKNVKADTENIGSSDSTRIFFDVANREDLTFLGKIEIVANDKCFYSTEEQPLSEIQPYGEIRSSIILRSKYLSSSNRQNCEGKPFTILMKLKDASGKILDEESITIGIIGS